MAITYTGTKPTAYFEKVRRDIIRVLNTEAAELERSLVQATPSGVSGGGGGLRSGWLFLPANDNNLVAVVGQSSRYFLPVEMGRFPGKGISKKGQVSLARWGKLKLGLGDQEARSMAFLVSRKYKREGRVAQGFAGLAREGDKAKSVGENIEPLATGIIGKSFNELRQSLDKI